MNQIDEIWEYDDPDIIPQAIKKHRLDCNLTLKQFGEQLDVDASTVWYWENGMRTPLKAYRDRLFKIVNKYQPIPNIGAYTHLIRCEQFGHLFKYSSVANPPPEGYTIIYSVRPGYTLPSIYEGEACFHDVFESQE